MPTELEAVTVRARAIARAQGHAAIRPTHLVLASMSRSDSPWPDLIVERGGLSYVAASRLLGWREPPQPPAPTGGRRRYRSSMRLTLLVAVIVALTVAREVLFRLFAVGDGTGSPGQLQLDADSDEVVRLARSLASSGDAPAPAGPGHLLLALASRPGEHQRVLPNATVLACDLRQRMGLATTRHRMILACDRPKLLARRTHMRLDREVGAHGHWSRWGLAWLAFGAAGSLFAVAAFPVTFLATLLLYVFLWPAALLIAGTRAVCGSLVGCEARSHHWLKIPGGDVALTAERRPASARAVAVALLAPRLLAALICVAALTMLLWRSGRLGVVVSPLLLRRPDLLTEAGHGAYWLTPVAIFAGMVEHDGFLAGVGLLAGLGAGVMSIPTFHEVELIRLHAGHETGGGSRFARALTAPASLFTGAVSCVEAVLPFTGAPIYATAYLVPLVLALIAAAAVLQLLPY